MNIKDYVNQNQDRNKKENSNYNKQENFSNNEKTFNQDSEQVKNLENDLNRYKNLSQNELMSELMKEAGRLKANGSLNDKSINSLRSTLSPMLTPEQNQMLEQLLNIIK